MRSLCEFGEVALDAAGGYPDGLFVEVQAGDLPGLDEVENEVVIDAEEFRDFLDGVEGLDLALGRCETQLLVDVRLHGLNDGYVPAFDGDVQRGKPAVQAKLSLGVFAKNLGYLFGVARLDGPAEVSDVDHSTAR